MGEHGGRGKTSRSSAERQSQRQSLLRAIPEAAGLDDASLVHVAAALEREWLTGAPAVRDGDGVALECALLAARAEIARRREGRP